MKESFKVWKQWSEEAKLNITYNPGWVYTMKGHDVILMYLQGKNDPFHMMNKEMAQHVF